MLLTTVVTALMTSSQNLATIRRLWGRRIVDRFNNTLMGASSPPLVVPPLRAAVGRENSRLCLQLPVSTVLIVGRAIFNPMAPIGF